ncbi:type II secretion system F family protein [Halobacillus sp. Nhm2S1]|uniref:type II secretion system F family protein n=1 Tax=Halobacillus sp. Nhm2S1 TaxID=2866716 RepID=UPI001C72F69E|nr:type II secretion system F family protein [Halobacillus sp. Nhm2S1]MBX0358874.1 type II secretion system F family protein [Halobacillus sp. Nhm2S1]
MPYYSYQGRSLLGKAQKGRLRANSRKEAVLSLKEQGITISEIKEIDSIFLKDIQIGSPVKPKDFVIYLRQFSTLMRAGISLLESTKILAKQSNSRALSEALYDISDQLESGRAFSEAAASHSKIFSNLFINMVRAGEVGGNLDDILERLAVYYEKQYDTRQKIISALTYPLVVGLIAVGIVIFLLTFVVPRFASMFDTMGGELPWITQLTLSMSQFFQSFWYLVILIPVVLFIAFKLLVDRNPKLQYTLDVLKLKIPVFGPLIQKAALVRMTSTLSSLMNSSVPILKSLQVTQNVVENKVVERAIMNSYKSLEKGNNLSDPLREYPIFPPLVIQMMAVGEETGSLDYMLSKVAEFYESELEYTTDRLKTLIEPLMILVLALVVGGIVAAIAVPMFSIFDTIN